MQDLKPILNFIIGEIPFLIFFSLLIYVLWIRPKRMQKRDEKDLKNTLEIGDEVVANDGMVGLVAAIKKDKLVIESGSFRNKYTIDKNNLYYNITAKERSKEAFSKLSLWGKIKYYI